MKMKNLFGLAAIAAVALSACSNDEVVENFSQDNAIQFSTYMGRNVQSRAAELTTPGLQEKGFGVFAFYTGQDSWSNKGASTTPNFMFNQKVTYTEGTGGATSSWTYSPIKYWPTTQNDKISFFAYGPYLNYEDNPYATVTPTKKESTDANAVAGAPTVTFTQSTDVTKMVDFVAGVAMDQTGPKTDYTSADPKTVEFKLKHELTRLNFAAKLDKNAFLDSDDKHKTRINITSVKIDMGENSKFYQSADYTFATQNDVTEGTPITYSGTWSNPTIANDDLNLDAILNKTVPTDIGSESATYKTAGIMLTGTTETPLFKEKKNADATATPPVEAQAAEYVFLIPPVQQDGTGLASGDIINVTFSYDIITMDEGLAIGYSKTSATKTVALPTGDSSEEPAVDNTLQQGKAYKFVFTFGLHEVKVSATVEGWGDEIEGENKDVNWTDEDETKTTTGDNV